MENNRFLPVLDEQNGIPGEHRLRCFFIRCAAGGLGNHQRLPLQLRRLAWHMLHAQQRQEGVVADFVGLHNSVDEDQTAFYTMGKQNLVEHHVGAIAEYSFHGGDGGFPFPYGGWLRFRRCCFWGRCRLSGSPAFSSLECEITHPLSPTQK
ncbi:hypothetical protein D3C75_849280 [compost metagenome]